LLVVSNLPYFTTFAVYDRRAIDHVYDTRRCLLIAENVNITIDRLPKIRGRRQHCFIVADADVAERLFYAATALMMIHVVAIAGAFITLSIPMSDAERHAPLRLTLLLYVSDNILVTMMTFDATINYYFAPSNDVTRYCRDNMFVEDAMPAR